MAVLLTGGAGYIGSHTAIALLNENLDVVIADDYSNSSPEVIRRLGIITGKHIPTYSVDATDPTMLGAVFTRHKIDAVIHFAGYKAVGESVHQPLKYYRNNLDSTLTLLELMKAHEVKRFIFSSSATVYGVPERMPLTEEMSTSAINPYGQTKLMIEQILRDISAADPDFSVVLLRYFNPVGAHESGLIGEDPNDIPNNLMPFISQVAVGKLPFVNVYGNDYPTKDGTGVRDYIHVMDLASGHVAALRYAAAHRGVEIFNLGTGIPNSVLEMIAAFEQVSGRYIPYKIAPRRKGDVASCYADPSKAENVLRWKAQKSIVDMCRDAWRWQSNNPDGYRKQGENGDV